ncbi:MAG: amino acid permease [Candidatus Eremiobacteraeota bacterium]|nr:amino acid permease [Candidatus Eremiobacteraeota bacterium]MBV8222348.1 amino acid permease [Candidatus Eremiobacteraeota bacterium]
MPAARQPSRLLTFVKRLLAVQPLSRVRPEEEGQPTLRRALGVPALIGIGLGTMLGGIFTTMGSGALAAGPGVIFAFVLSGAACVFVALCYAEFASMVPVAGSAYTYAYATLGELVAWVIGWDLILEYGISAAPVASSLSGSLQDGLAFFGLKLPSWATTANLATSWVPANLGPVHFGLLHIDLAASQYDIIAALSVVAISILLAIGIRESAFVNSAFVWVQLGAFVLFFVVLAHGIKVQNFTPFLPRGFHAVVQSAALVFFAYIGFDTVTVASEESRNPQRDVPRAVIGSLAIGGILYILIAIFTIGVVPWQHMDAQSAMTQAMRAVTSNGIVIFAFTLGAVLGTTAVMVTSLLGQTRIFYVMARDRMLPPVFAAVHPRFRTPARMTIITGVIVAFLALIVPLEKLLELVNIGTLSAFVIVSAGVFVLRFVAPHAHRPFKAPFGLGMATLGFLSCLWMMSALPMATWIRFIVWFAAGVVIYLLYGYRHSLLRNDGSSQQAASTAPVEPA